MTESFAENRAELENFEDDLTDLCLDIVEASYDDRAANDKTRPLSLDGIYAAPPELLESLRESGEEISVWGLSGDQFDFARYRADIHSLAHDDLLSRFLDEARPGQFDEVIDRLGRATELLDLATGYTGLEELIALLDNWQGDAAYNFQHDIFPKYGVSVVHQLVFVDELIAVAMCLRELVLRCRGDGLGLAENLLDKVTRDEKEVPWGTILWVAGSVVAAVATFGASAAGATAVAVAARVGFSLNTASGALGEVQKLSGSDEEKDRAIEGETAYEFIPSCREQIDNVIDKGITEYETVMYALRRDLDSEGVDNLIISKPTVIDGEAMNIVDAENRSEGYLIESLADLRYAGAVTLPVMAEYFDKAYREVDGLKELFDLGIGRSRVATLTGRHLDVAIVTLCDSFEVTRDYLYRAGVALTDIADTYFDNEEQRQAVMENFSKQLEEFDEDVFERYEPKGDSGRPRTDG